MKDKIEAQLRELLSKIPFLKDRLPFLNKSEDLSDQGTTEVDIESMDEDKDKADEQDDEEQLIEESKKKKRTLMIRVAIGLLFAYLAVDYLLMDSSEEGNSGGEEQVQALTAQEARIAEIRKQRQEAKRKAEEEKKIQEMAAQETAPAAEVPVQAVEPVAPIAEEAKPVAESPASDEAARDQAIDQAAAEVPVATTTEEIPVATTTEEIPVATTTEEIPVATTTEEIPVAPQEDSSPSTASEPATSMVEGPEVTEPSTESAADSSTEQMTFADDTTTAEVSPPPAEETTPVVEQSPVPAPVTPSPAVVEEVTPAADSASINQSVVQKEEKYVPPPDFEERGRGLVYNCKGRHWACVSRKAYFQCRKNERWQTQNGKPLECHLDKTYSTDQDCEVMQKYKINTNAPTDFCGN